MVFRLCDAVRAERLYLCGITGYPPVEGDTRPPWVAARAGREIAKTAIHSVDLVPWTYRPVALDVLHELRQGGTQVVALEQTAASVDYAIADYHFPVCLVIGHERTGVADPILDIADLRVDIPMFGQGRSLNVAMAFGICAYQIVHRRVIGSMT